MLAGPEVRLRPSTPDHSRQGCGKNNKNTGPVIDRSAPDRLPEHIQSRIHNGKRSKKARRYRAEVNETRDGHASSSGTRPHAENTETSTLAPASTPLIASHISDGPGQLAALSGEAKESMWPNPTAPDNQQNNQDHRPSTEEAGPQSPTDDHEPSHRRDESSSRRPSKDKKAPASACSTISSSQFADADALTTLGELHQWLKLQSIMDGPRRPIVCYIANTRLPQPQDYRFAQQGRQPKKRRLRAIVDLSASLRTGQDDLFAHQIRTRQRAEEQAGATQTSSRLKTDSRKAENPQKGKTKKSSQSSPRQSVRSSPLTSPRKGAASPSRRSAVSAASSTDPSPSTADQPPISGDNFNLAPLASYLSSPGIDEFVLDANAALPKSPSPTTCMHFTLPNYPGTRQPPDLSTLRKREADNKAVPKPSERQQQVLDEERKRNNARKRKESKEKRKAFKALQMEKALGGAGFADNGGTQIV